MQTANPAVITEGAAQTASGAAPFWLSSTPLLGGPRAAPYAAADSSNHACAQSATHPVRMTRRQPFSVPPQRHFLYMQLHSRI
jgi:hypothetical protein